MGYYGCGEAIGEWKWRMKWERKICRGMIIELVGPQRPLWPWNSDWEREEVRKVCLSLCVCPSDSGGHRVRRCVWTSSSLKLPPRCRAAGQNYPSSCCSRLLQRSTRRAERRRVYKRKGKQSLNREEKQAKSRKRGSGRVDLPKQSDFYRLCWFVLVVHMKKLLLWHAAIKLECVCVRRSDHIWGHISDSRPFNRERAVSPIGKQLFQSVLMSF